MMLVFAQLIYAICLDYSSVIEVKTADPSEHLCRLTVGQTAAKIPAQDFSPQMTCKEKLFDVM